MLKPPDMSEGRDLLRSETSDFPPLMRLLPLWFS